jgi:hypothetical protein
VVRAAAADVLLITGIDHDFRGRALAAFLDLVRAGKDGIDYAHVFAPGVNAGVPSGLDLDLDGRTMGWDDAFGWGKFPGHGGMALVSRLPIDAAAARTFLSSCWRDLPGREPARAPRRHALAERGGAGCHAAVVAGALGRAGALPGGGRLHLLAAYPTPPLFDGPEGRNLRRNHDEIDFWRQYLDGLVVARRPGPRGGRAAGGAGGGARRSQRRPGGRRRAAGGGAAAAGASAAQDPRPASAGGARPRRPRAARTRGTAATRPRHRRLARRRRAGQPAGRLRAARRAARGRGGGRALAEPGDPLADGGGGGLGAPAGLGGRPPDPGGLDRVAAER